MSFAEFMENINLTWGILWNIELFNGISLLLILLFVLIFSIFMGFMKGH